MSESIADYAKGATIWRCNSCGVINTLSLMMKHASGGGIEHDGARVTCERCGAVHRLGAVLSSERI